MIGAQYLECLVVEAVIVMLHQSTPCRVVWISVVHELFQILALVHHEDQRRIFDFSSSFRELTLVATVLSLYLRNNNNIRRGCAGCEFVPNIHPPNDSGNDVDLRLFSEQVPKHHHDFERERAKIFSEC